MDGKVSENRKEGSGLGGIFPHIWAGEDLHFSVSSHFSGLFAPPSLGFFSSHLPGSRQAIPRILSSGR